MGLNKLSLSYKTSLPCQASFLSPPWFVNGLKAFRSTIKYDAGEKNTVIQGLLVTRQYYYCPNAGDYICESTHCCPGGWNCCRDGGCCVPTEYCVIASNGQIGCCPNGEVCEGPVEDPQTIDSPSPKTTKDVESTITNDFTTAFTSTSTSTSISTTTFTTLLGAPTPAIGTQIIEVSVLDIIWSENWVQEVSSCSPSLTSKSTTTAGSSFTYTFQYSSSLYGYFFYFNLVNYNTMWEVFVNGVSQSTYDSSATDNCTYFEMYYSSLDISSPDISSSQNITLVVQGSDLFDSSTSSWSLEVNKLLISEQNIPSTSTSALNTFTQNPATATGLALNNGAKRTQPYLSLMGFGGVALAMMIMINRV